MKLSIIILLFLSSISDSFSAKFDEDSMVSFHCEIINPSECIEIAGLSSDKIEPSDSIENGIESILHHLAGLGYPLAIVDSISNKRESQIEIIDVYFSINNPLRLNSIQNIEGNSPDRINTLAGKQRIVSSNLLLAEANKLLHSYADQGFPFANVTVLPSNIINDDVDLATDLRFSSIKGDFIRIGSVVFPGRVTTSIRLLRSESRIRRGSTFNQTFINRALSRLNKLEYISQREPIRLIASSPGIVDLHIPVSENKVSTFSGIAAYDQQDDKIRGDINLSLSNILGTGRKLTFVWEGLDHERNGVSVEYQEPWLLGYPLQATFGVNIWSGDSIGVRFNRFVGLDWQPNFNITLGSGIKFENLRLPDNISTDENYSSIWISINGSIDYLDRLWNPEGGIYLSTTSSTGIRKVASSGSGSWRLRQDQVTLRFIKKLHRKFIISQFSKIEDIRGDNVTIADLIPLGGINSLRGYAEGRNLIRGVYINNLELRWRLDDCAYFGIFNDIGWVYRKDSRYIVDDVLSSIGLTTGIQSKSTKFNINIGLAKGEPIQQARLHIRIKRFF